MSSVNSIVASAKHGSRFFVSLAANSDIYTSNASPVPGLGWVPAGVVVRDMGKTIRTPSDSPIGAITTQVILRKVARVLPSNGVATSLVNGMASSYNGFVETVEDVNNPYYTFYINITHGEWAAITV